MRRSLLMRSFFYVTSLVFALLIVRLPEAQAATLIVTNLNDSGAGSLRDTIAGAGVGDTITFSISGTITLTSGHIALTKNIIIDGTTPTAGQNIIISGNNASRIFYIDAAINVELRNIGLRNGNASAIMSESGGAIFNNLGTLIISNSTFSNNQSSMGGGAIASSGSTTLTINDSTFSSNTSGDGGAVNSGGTLVINNSTFFGNSGLGSAGAIFNFGTATINNSNFSENGATMGGAVLNDAATLSIHNSTFSNNRARDFNSGHIYNAEALATISYSTFVSNDSTQSGINSDYFATMTLTASIFSNVKCRNVRNSILNNGGNNIAYNADGCPGARVDPRLGTLGFYGSDMQTIPLLPGSPALDAITTGCPAVDQRGVTRPQGAGCDIGAFERQRSYRTVTNLNDSGAGSLRDVVANANPNDTIIFSVSGTITLQSVITISKNLTIDGSEQNVTIAGNNIGKALQVNGAYVVFDLHSVTMTAGGLNNIGGTVSVTESTFTANTQSAIVNLTGVMLIDRSTFTNNTSSTFGGAIYNFMNLTISNSTFSGNSADIGGALANREGNVIILSSTFAGNSAATGGAINHDGDLAENMQIINSTFVNNHASMWGGGLYIETGFTDIISSTFSGNSAATGGGIYTRSGMASIAGTIIANSTSGNDCYGGIFTNGNNIIGDANTFCYIDPNGTDRINTNPMLGTLGNYGGATQTMPLLEGSPAIDSYTAGCPLADQRGVMRPQEAACDIGAFEVQLIPTSVTITENDMFTAVQSVRDSYPDIGTVVVDFVPNAMNLSVALTSGVVGNVRVELAQADGFVTFNIANITINGTPGPTSYVSIINRDLPNILTTVLDNLIIERFGSLVDAHTMTIDNSVLIVAREP